MGFHPPRFPDAKRAERMAESDLRAGLSDAQTWVMYAHRPDLSRSAMDAVAVLRAELLRRGRAA